ncbi:MAG: hypothetical protein ACLT4Y_12100 [Bifidobacterium breve]
MARWKCSSTIFSGYLDLVKDTPHADGATYRSSLDQRDVLGPVTVSVFAVVRPISISGGLGNTRTTAMRRSTYARETC